MRKFLFIAANEWANWGGSELLWSQAAEKLAQRGSEVRVSVPDFGRTMREVERIRSAGCRIFYRRPASFLARQAQRIFPAEEFALSHMRAAGEGADLVVISPGAVAGALKWAEAARALGLAYAVIVQGATELLWPDDVLAEKLAPGYEGAARAYFVSEATLNLCRHQLGVALPRGKVIRNPFNVRYDMSLPWPEQAPDELSLACVARLHVPTKSHDLLLKVLSLPHWRARKVRVSLVGEGPHQRTLRKMADGLNLSNLDFLGHQNDIEAVWRRHHALVLASRMEGMPLVVVEAMLCGRPCIATDVGGNRELIRDGENGFLVRAATVELLDEGMNRAWMNRNSLRTMGEAAARDVRAWVSPDPAEDFVEDLESLVSSRVRSAEASADVRVA